MSKESGNKRLDGDDGSQNQAKQFNEIIGRSFNQGDMNRISHVLNRLDDTSKFEGDPLLTFLGHSAARMLSVASDEGIKERTRHDKEVTPITVQLGDEKREIGFVKQVPPEDSTKKTMTGSHLVVMNNGEIYETEPASEEDKANYAKVMNRKFALSGITLDDEGKISPEATRRLFTLLEIENGVRVKATREDPEMYAVLLRTLGIDPVLKKHVDTEYEPLVEEKAAAVVESAEVFLRQGDTQPSEDKPKRMGSEERDIIPPPRYPDVEQLDDE